MANDLDRLRLNVADQTSVPAGLGQLLGNIANMLKGRGDAAASFAEMIGREGQVLINDVLTNTKALSVEVANGFKHQAHPNPSQNNSLTADAPRAQPAKAEQAQAGLSGVKTSTNLPGTEPLPESLLSQEMAGSSVHPTMIAFNKAKAENTAARWNAFIGKYEGPDNRPGGLVDQARQARAKIR